MRLSAIENTKAVLTLEQRLANLERTLNQAPHDMLQLQADENPIALLSRAQHMSFAEASDIYQTILHREDNSLALKYAQALILRDGLGGQKHNVKQAIINFNELIKAGVDIAYCDLGILYLQQIQDQTFCIDQPIFHKAKFCFERLIKSHPKFAEALTTRIYDVMIADYIKLGEFDSAVKYSDEARRISETPEVYTKKMATIEAMRAAYTDSQTIYRQYMTEPDQFSSLNMSGKNPMFDFYYGRELIEHEDKTERARGLELLANVFRDGQYSPALLGVVNFVRGLFLTYTLDRIISESGMEDMPDYDSLLRLVTQSHEDCFRQAESAYSLACDQGFTLAYNFLGLLCFQQDREPEARHYFNLGARIGCPHASNNLYDRFLDHDLSQMRNQSPSRPLLDLLRQSEKVLLQVVDEPFYKQQRAEVCHLPRVRQLILENSVEPVQLCQWETTLKQANADVLKQLKKKLITSKSKAELESIQADLNFVNTALVRYFRSTTNRAKISWLEGCIMRLENVLSKFRKYKHINTDSLHTLLAAARYVREVITDSQADKDLQILLNNLATIRQRPNKLKSYVQLMMTLNKGCFLKGKHIIERLDPHHRAWLNPRYEHNNLLFQEWASDMAIDDNFFGWLKKNNRFHDKRLTPVHYFTPEQARMFSVSMHENHIVYPLQNDQPLEDDDYIYVVDKDDNIYIAKEGVRYVFAKTGIQHHSSFVRGENILCGGDLIIENGKIVYIDNGSGHYEPDANDFNECIQAIADKSMLADNVKLKVIGNLRFNQAMSLDVFRAQLPEIIAAQDIAELPPENSAQDNPDQANIGDTSVSQGEHVFYLIN